MADLTPEALAADLEALAAAKDAKAASADTGDMCAWYRGCGAGLANAAGRIRHYLVPAHAALTGQLAGALEDYQDLHDRLGAWPQCPDGCGCDLATGDPDAQECACDGPCTMECRENGYPDAPSYRDLAVNAERERIKGLFGTWIDIINPAGEPNSHPPEAWKTAFADLISDKPQFTLDAREALEGGHG
jgi:hypothetical protein